MKSGSSASVDSFDPSDPYDLFDPHRALPCNPWRLSGLVLGTLLNDPAQLRSLGAAVDEAPYKAPPRQPVLYLKPRNTLMAPLSPCVLPPGAAALVCGVSLGLVIGRTLCRAREAAALQAVAALTVVVDLHLPHADFYRPSVPLRALDRSCRMSLPMPWEAGDGADPDAVALSVQLDGRHVALGTTGEQHRSAAKLLADISAFMTLRPGDVLLTGVRHASPLLRAGQRVRVQAAGVGVVGVSVVAAAVETGASG